MRTNRNWVTITTLVAVGLLGTCSRPTSIVDEDKNMLVRLAFVAVDTSSIGAYNDFLKEEIEASIRLEPGVITLYAVAEKEDPSQVTLFETYADSSQYRSHLATPHFHKYKEGTLQMVRHLDLIQTRPLFYHRKDKLSTARMDDLYIRLIKIEVHSNAVDHFKKLGGTIMLPGIKTEPGVLAMYGVAELANPARVSILEVYKDMDAYNRHLETAHYLEYKEASKDLVKSLKLIDVKPILLGSKPQ